jgi:hypothetical protein
MIAYATTHITIGALILRTRAYDCWDWSDLLNHPAKRGTDRIIPGVAGRSVRPRVVDAARCVLPVRLNGDWTANNTSAGGTDIQRHERVYDHLKTLHTIVTPTTTQTLTFTYGAKSVSVSCIVEGCTAPQFETPSLATVVLDVTLPAGPLTLV